MNGLNKNLCYLIPSHFTFIKTDAVNINIEWPNYYQTYHALSCILGNQNMNYILTLQIWAVVGGIVLRNKVTNSIEVNFGQLLWVISVTTKPGIILCVLAPNNSADIYWCSTNMYLMHGLMNNRCAIFGQCRTNYELSILFEFIKISYSQTIHGK